MLTTHDLRELRTRSAAVFEAAPTSAALTARDAARCISGVVRLVGVEYGVDVARQACASLARHGRAWPTLRNLPINDNQTVATAVSMLATVVLGVLPMAGEHNLRAALSFWACEDVATWQAVAG